MTVLKWFSFALIFTDFIAYIINTVRTMKSISGLAGFVVGLLCRAFVLYGTVTCWLLG